MALGIAIYAVTPPAGDALHQLHDDLSAAQAITIAEQMVHGRAISLRYARDRSDLQYDIRVVGISDTFDVHVNAENGAFTSAPAE